MDRDELGELLREIHDVPTEVRLSGDRWTEFMDRIRERCGVEPDARPRLYIAVTRKEGAR